MIDYKCDDLENIELGIYEWLLTFKLRNILTTKLEIYSEIEENC